MKSTLFDSSGSSLEITDASIKLGMEISLLAQNIDVIDGHWDKGLLFDKASAAMILDLLRERYDQKIEFARFIQTHGTGGQASEGAGHSGGLRGKVRPAPEVI